MKKFLKIFQSAFVLFTMLLTSVIGQLQAQTTINPPFQLEIDPDANEFPPTGWDLLYGELTADSELTVEDTEENWSRKFFGNLAQGFGGGYPTPGIDLNVPTGFSSIYSWFISPAVDLGDGSAGFNLEFELRITADGITTRSQLGPEDYFAVVISTDNGATWSSENVLYELSGANGDEITDTEEVEISLEEYTGEVKIGFYAERVSGETPDIDLFIGRIQSNVVSGASLTVIPDSIGFDDMFINDTQSKEFTVTNTGFEAIDVEITSDNTLFSISNGSTFSIPTGESRQVEVQLSPGDNDGEQTGVLTVSADGAAGSPRTVGVSGVVIAPPIAEVSPSSIEVTASTGDIVSETLTISNTGAEDLTYSVNSSFLQIQQSKAKNKPVQTFQYEKFGEITEYSSAALTTPKKSKSGSVNTNAAFSFEEDDGFTQGFIGGQNGWTVYSNNTLQPVISDERASIGNYAMKLSKHNELAQNTPVGAFSPDNISVNGPEINVSFDMYFSGTGGSDYDFYAQAPSLGSLTSRIKFRYTGDILVADYDASDQLAFIDTGTSYTANSWFTVNILINSDTEEMSYYINGDLFWESSWFGAGIVEQLIIAHDNYNAGESLFIDNIKIEAPEQLYTFGSASGTIAPGASEDVTVNFNTNTFAGEYESVIEMASNDPVSPLIEVPVSYTLLSDTSITFANLEIPGALTISEGDEIEVAGEVFIDGITGGTEAVSDLTMWLGISAENTNPSTWSESSWREASFDQNLESNDRFNATIGSELTTGTYYLATRFRYQKEAYIYGGYSASGGGIWESEIYESGVLTVEVAVSNKTDEQPVSFSLDQNYPNPFNPTTQIIYSIPNAAYVQLDVFDMLGRKVQSLVSERKQMGSHQVIFDASNFSSGIYIYRLQAGAFVDTRKLTLIK